MTARGIDRRAIFADDRDRRHFLELLSAMAERYGVVAAAIKRFETSLVKDSSRRKLVERGMREMRNMET